MDDNFVIVDLKEGRTCKHFYFDGDECLYKKDRERKGTKYFKCIEKNCKCRAKMSGNLMERTNDKVFHNHENHKHKFEFEVSFSKLKVEVANNSRSVQSLHKESIRKLSLQASGMMEWENVRHTLQRIRRDLMPSCSNLEKMIDLLETDDNVYKSFGMLRDDAFYQGTVDEKMPVFANLELIAELGEQIEIFVDATFGVTPFHTHQLLVILAELNGYPRPIAYAVMTARSEKQYFKVFQHLRDAILPFDGINRIPIAATTDFEKAMRRALVKTWPNIQCFGCNFHFCQALRRYARSLGGLSRKLDNYELHHTVLMMFMRLSLLPLNRIDTGLKALQSYIKSSPVLRRDFKEFLIYFQKTWIKRFPKIEWCVSDRTRRTNNNLEGYNRFIKQSIGLNPSPWMFLQELLDLAYNASSKYQSDVQKERQAPSDRSRLTVPLKNALSKLENGQITELGFLKQMSYANNTEDIFFL